VSNLALINETMADQKKRNDKAVKISRDLAAKAKLIAESKGIPVAEYLSELLRGPVERDWPKAVKTIEEQSGR
jgi:hypothetical protein